MKTVVFFVVFFHIMYLVDDSKVMAMAKLQIRRFFVFFLFFGFFFFQI